MNKILDGFAILTFSFFMALLILTPIALLMTVLGLWIFVIILVALLFFWSISRFALIQSEREN